MKNRATLTLKDLFKARLCESTLADFSALFGTSVVVTPGNASRVHDKFEWAFAGRLLTGRWRDTYNAASWDAYLIFVQTCNDISDRARRIKFNKARARAFALAYIQMKKEQVP